MDLGRLIRRINRDRSLDLNGLIKKIEKYLGKDLKFSMREFKQLQLLREDILKLEEIIRHHGKDQAVSLEHYKEHAQKLERYSGRIERRLNVWIRRLERLITAEEQNLTPKDRQYFEFWKTKMNICKNNLVRILAKGGELHKLINEDSPDWKKVEAKINEAMGSNQSPALKTLIVLFQQLEQTEEKLGKESVQEISKEEYQRRLEQLNKWDFPAERESQLADFLIKHWNGTTEIAKAAGRNSFTLFIYGLPAVKDIINEKTWPMVVEGFVELAKAVGNNLYEFFIYGWPVVRDIINEKTWPMVVEGLVEIAKVGGMNSYMLFIYGLPAVKDFINEKTWPMVVEGLVEIAKAAGGDVRHIYEGLPAVKDIINERTWPMIVEGIVKHMPRMKKYVEGHLGFIPESLLNDFKPFVNSKSVYDLDKQLEQQTSFAKQYFDEFGFTVYTKKIVNENFWNFNFDPRIFNRLKFKKTGSTLIPLGGRFKTKYLIRIISQKSFEAWKKAQESGIPVEEIITERVGRGRKYRAYPTKDGKHVRVYCKYAGESLEVFVINHPKLAQEVERQKDEIIKRLEKLKIEHGHLHDGNFTVAEENGKLVVRVIDFDQAVSPP